MLYQGGSCVIIQIDMSKAFKDNYLTLQNGCTIAEVTSEKDKAPASNILSDDRKSLWVTKEPLPQHCIINTQSLRQYPKVFNRVGFFCWHDFESNPELIEVAYSNRLDGEWIVAGKIRLSLVAEKQYFKIKDIPVSEMKFLKIAILKNFGDVSTYLNQVQLGYVKQAQADNGREKTFSEYVKLTSTERELKRALDQIKVMKGQQQQLRNTVSKQNELMQKMQEEIRLLAKHQERFNKVQDLQNNRIQILEEGGYTAEKREKSRIYTPGLVDSSDQDKNPHRALIEEGLLQKKTLPVSKPNKSMSYTKSNKQSLTKAKDIDVYLNLKKSSKMNSILKSREAAINDSQEPNLSEYDSSDNDRSRHSEKCTELVFKLQRLLAEKDRRIKEHNKRSDYRQK